MRQLISFLGSGTYARCVYQLDGEQWPPTAHFGLELARRARCERLLLFGTTGSMWDVLLSDALGDREAEAAHLELLEAAGRQAVTAAQLQAVRPQIEKAVGLPVVLQLIGECRSSAEQRDVLSKMAELVAEGDRLIMDVTHGFRHQPMLALVAAAYLRSTHSVRIERILYGAFSMKNKAGVAPAVDVSALLEILGWIEGLAAFDAGGNLASLAGPLHSAGLSPEGTARLRAAGFCERNQMTETVAHDLTRVHGELRKLSSPALALFKPQLEQRLGWAAPGPRWRHEWELAERHAERGDWLRAAILWTEAAISRSLTGTRELGSAAARMRAKDRLKEVRVFSELYKYRSGLVHGNHADPKVAEALTNPEQLPAALRRLAAELRTQIETTSLPTGAAGA